MVPPIAPVVADCAKTATEISPTKLQTMKAENNKTNLRNIKPLLKIPIHGSL
jgi:hypothetical protein